MNLPKHRHLVTGRTVSAMWESPADYASSLHRPPPRPRVLPQIIIGLLAAAAVCIPLWMLLSTLKGTP